MLLKNTYNLDCYLINKLCCFKWFHMNIRRSVYARFLMLCNLASRYTDSLFWGSMCMWPTWKYQTQYGFSRTESPIISSLVCTHLCLFGKLSNASQISQMIDTSSTHILVSSTNSRSPVTLHKLDMLTDIRGLKHGAECGIRALLALHRWQIHNRCLLPFCQVLQTKLWKFNGQPVAAWN